MSRAKIAISIDENTLRRIDRLVREGVFPNRSQAMQAAVDAHLARLGRDLLVRACAKLDPAEEQAMTEEGVRQELMEWPEY